MSDALISPAVGGALWAAAGAVTAISARALRHDRDERRTALMGVLGAFVFSAQMINFAIPMTGSSGHLGGGLLLAILLGPHAAFLTIASVLTVQALFFADGGLLALGCNIINLGLFPCFIAYPFVYQRLAGGVAAGGAPARGRIMTASVAAAMFALQLGALAVVLETWSSGISELPLKTFALLMQPIHLAIGLIEGLVTAAVVGFVGRARPEILAAQAAPTANRPAGLGKVLAGLALAAVLTAGVLSWFASNHPDGLEWATQKITGREALAAPQGGVYAKMERLQTSTALMPDYEFKPPEHSHHEPLAGEPPAPPRIVKAGTSAAGLIGAGLTLALVAALGWALRFRRAR